ncbi:MFS general substrate transporter [Cystobasidium minutum MCA 4210]|uniref:MFS general substrate transporter n=1 Tax=Cystobasidium minutum MCA 4210 TaxID=1397322 RepID=UPI0034CF33C8|eukprot:jgi/Rhomi1/188046/estExt_fgenesh1_pg.C_2_t10335
MTTGPSTSIPNEQSPLLQHHRGAADPADHQHYDVNNDNTHGQVQQQRQSLPATSFKLWMLILAYSSLLFLFSSNATGITTMYASIAETLSAYHNAATWMTASYMIASSCTTPLVGRLSTIFQPTSIFLAATTIFGAGQLTAGLAPNASTFIFGRVLTGAGAGGLFTTTNVLLIEGAPVHRRGLLLGIVNCVVTCGSSLGGVIGGALAASSYGWRPAFTMQVPIAAVSALIVYICSPTPPPRLPRLTRTQKLGKIDYAGIITLSGSMTLLLTAAMAPTFTLTPLIAGAFTLFLFILIEARFAQLPIIPVSLLANPATLFSCLCSLLSMTARWVLLYYSPIWAMSVLGFHPAQAGATLIPTSVGFGLGGLVVGAYSVRHAGGYYWQSLVSVALFTLTYVAFYCISATAPISQCVGLLVLNGLGAGAVLVYTLAHILSTTHEKAIVTGLYNTFRGLAPSFGAGVAGGILQRRIQKSLIKSILPYRRDGRLTPEDWLLINRLKGSPTLVWQLAGWQREVGIKAYEYAIKVIFLFAIAAGILSLIAQAFTYPRAAPDPADKELDDEDPIQERTILDD